MSIEDEPPSAPRKGYFSLPTVARSVRSPLGQPLGQQPPVKPPQSLTVRLDGAESLDHLTASSKTHLEGRIQQFTVQVVAEAKAIEQREHAGKGPPEVTAAHIDEAWWVLRRRIRGAKHPILVVLARTIQAFGAAGVGVGATSFQAKWGQVVFMICCVATFGAFLLEMYAGKRD